MKQKIMISIITILLIIISGSSEQAHATSITYLNDTFDRPDSTDIGLNWSGNKNLFNITSNRLTRTGTNGYNGLIIINNSLMLQNSTGYSVENNYRGIIGAGYAYFYYTLIYMQNTSGNYGYGYAIEIDDSGTRRAKLLRLTGDSRTQVSSFTISTNAWDNWNTLKIVAVENEAKFSLFKNGIYYGYLNDESNTFTNGYCGIGAYYNTEEFDEFSCYNTELDTIVTDNSSIDTNHDYVLTQDMVWKDITVTMNSSVIVPEPFELTLDNVTLYFTGITNLSNRLYVNGGTLITGNNTLISPLGDYKTQIDFVGNSKVRISNSTFKYLGNRTTGDYGLRFFGNGGNISEYSYTNYIRDSTFYGSKSISTRDCVYAVIQLQSGINISGNRFINTSSCSPGGNFIYIWQTTNALVEKNIFEGNEISRIGIYTSSTTGTTIKDNIIHGVWDYTLDIWGPDTNVIISNNRITDSQKPLVLLNDIRGVVFENNIINLSDPDRYGTIGWGTNVNNTIYRNNTYYNADDCLGGAGAVNDKQSYNNSVYNLRCYDIRDQGLVSGTRNSILTNIFMQSGSTNKVAMDFIYDSSNSNNTYRNITTINFGYGLKLANTSDSRFIDINSSGTIYDIQFLGNNTNNKFINHYFRENKLNFNNNEDQFEPYYYLNAEISKENEPSLGTITIQIINELNPEKTSINRDYENKSIFTTRSDAITYNPIENDSESICIQDYTRTNSAWTNYTYTLRAYDSNNIWTNITQTVYPNGTIQQLTPLAQLTGINPNETWYRPNPNTPTVTLELVIPENYTRTNITIETESEMNITVNSWQPESTGIIVNFTAETTDGNNVNFIICNLTGSTQYTIKKDSANFATKTSNAQGCITFNNSAWTEHEFTIEEYSTESTSNSYYLSIYGSDANNGTSISQAWGNLSYACNQIQAGDTLYIIDDGTYYYHSCTLSKSGNTTGNITITSYNGTAKFHGYNYTGTAFDLNEKDYIVIDNIKVENYSLGLIGFGCYSYLKNSDIGKTSNEVLRIDGHTFAMSRENSSLHDLYIINNRIHDTAMTGSPGPNMVNINGGVPSAGEGTAYNIYFLNNDIYGTGLHVCLNIQSNNPGYNNQTQIGLMNLTFENNSIHDLWGGPTNPTYPGIAFYTIYGSAYRVYIKNNRIYNYNSYGIRGSYSESILDNNHLYNLSGICGIYLEDTEIRPNNTIIRNNLLENLTILLEEIDNYTVINNTAKGYATSDNQTITNPVDSTYDASAKWNGTIIIEYTDNKVFQVTKTVSNQPNIMSQPIYNSNRSKASLEVFTTAASTMRINSYPMYTTPSYDYLNIIINDIKQTQDTWNITVTSSQPENPTLFTLETLNPSTIYAIKIDSTTIATNTTDDSGILIYFYNATGDDWTTSHTFEFIAQESPDTDPNTFYVRTDGNDTCSGQINQSYAENQTDCAWQTITHALTQLTAGQTVRIQQGIYEESSTLANSGNTTDRIIIIGENGAIMEGNYTRGCAINSSDEGYFSITGLTFRNYLGDGSNAAIYILSGTDKSSVTISNNTIENSKRGIYIRSISLSSYDNIRIANNTITNSTQNTLSNDAAIETTNSINAIISGNNITLGNTNISGIIWGGTNTTIRSNTITGGFKALSTATSQSLVEHNTIDSSLRGIRFDARSTGNIITANTIRNINTPRAGFDLYPGTAFISIDNNIIDNSSFLLYGVQNSTITENTITNNSYVSMQSATNVYYYDLRNITFISNTFTDFDYMLISHNSTDIAITRNIFYNSSNSEGAIYVGSGASIARWSNINISNNIFYKNTNAVNLETTAQQMTEIRIKNNIFMNSSASCIKNNTAENLEIKYNLIYNNQSTAFTNVYATNTLLTDPKLADPENLDFHLKSEYGRWNGTGWVTDNETSPCIDAGDPDDAYANEPEPNGGRINIGIYGNTGYASKSSEPPNPGFWTVGIGGDEWRGNVTFRNTTVFYKSAVLQNGYSHSNIVNIQSGGSSNLLKSPEKKMAMKYGSYGTNTVDKIGLYPCCYFPNNTNETNWTVGIQGDLNGLPSGTYITNGTYTNARDEVWDFAIMKEPATLEEDKAYWIVVQYESGPEPNTTDHYLGLYASAATTLDYDYGVNGIPLAYNYYGQDKSQNDLSEITVRYFDGSDWHNDTNRRNLATYVVGFNDSTYHGQPYVHNYAPLGYGLYQAAEVFRNYDQNKTINQIHLALSVLHTENILIRPKDNLYYSLRKDGWNGELLSSGIFMTPDQAYISGPGNGVADRRWYNSTLDEPVTLVANETYFLSFSSPGSNSTAQWHSDTPNSFENYKTGEVKTAMRQTTFDSTNSYYMRTEDEDPWSDNRRYYGADISFRLRMVDTYEGTMTSLTKDSREYGNSTDVWDSISFDGTIPEGTEVSIYINTTECSGFTPVVLDASPYTTYELPGCGKNRYANYKITFSTIDTTLTPEIYNITLYTSIDTQRTNYYLSTKGNDANTGTTVSDAWSNLSYACDQLEAGDTLYIIDDGTYYNHTCTPTHSGNETHPITIRSYNLTTPRLISPYSSSPNAIGLTNYDYWTIQGLYFEGYGTGVYMRNSIGCKVENNTFYHQYSSSVAFVDAESCSMVNNNISYVRWNSIQISGTTTGSKDIYIGFNDISHGLEHGLLDFMYNFSRITVEDNVFHDAGQIGLYVHQTDTDGYLHSGRIYIRRNTFTRVEGIQFDDPADNSIISDNIIYNLSTYQGGMYMRIYDTDSGITDNLTVRNNTIYGDASEGYMTYFKVNGLLFEGNNISGTSGDTEIRLLGGSTTTNIIRDTMTTEPNYVIYDANYGFTVEYHNGRIFTMSSTTPQYYPDKSNATRKVTASSTIRYYDMFALPSSGNLTIAINTISKISDTWNITVASSEFENPTTFTLETLYPNTNYTIRIDAETIAINTTDESGILRYFYNATGNDWTTSHTFEFIRIISTTLDTPINNYKTKNSTITFTCSCTTLNTLTNIALWSNWTDTGEWHANETRTVTGQTNETTFQKTLPGGTYVWNCRSLDNESNNAFARENHTFTIDQTEPEITITSPENQSILTYTTTSLSLNITTNENAICRYNTTTANFNYTESQNMTTTGTTTHTMTISVSAGNTYTYYYKCNDTVGNINENSTVHRFSVASTPSSSTSSSGSAGTSGGSGGAALPTPTLNDTENPESDNKITGNAIDTNKTEENNITDNNHTIGDTDNIDDEPDTDQSKDEQTSIIKYLVPVVIILTLTLIAAKLHRDKVKNTIVAITPKNTIEELETRKRKLDEIETYISQIRPVITEMILENQLDNTYEQRLYDIEKELESSRQAIEANPDPENTDYKIENIVRMISELKNEIESNR